MNRKNVLTKENEPTKSTWIRPQDGWNRPKARTSNPPDRSCAQKYVLMGFDFQGIWHRRSPATQAATARARSSPVLHSVDLAVSERPKSACESQRGLLAAQPSPSQQQPAKKNRLRLMKLHYRLAAWLWPFCRRELYLNVHFCINWKMSFSINNPAQQRRFSIAGQHERTRPPPPPHPLDVSNSNVNALFR